MNILPNKYSLLWFFERFTSLFPSLIHMTYCYEYIFLQRNYDYEINKRLIIATTMMFVLKLVRKDESSVSDLNDLLDNNFQS